MGRGINRLSGADLRRSKPGIYGDGNGLWLQVSVAKDGKRAGEIVVRLRALMREGTTADEAPDR